MVGALSGKKLLSTGGVLEIRLLGTGAKSWLACSGRRRSKRLRAAI